MSKKIWIIVIILLVVGGIGLVMLSSSRTKTSDSFSSSNQTSTAPTVLPVESNPITNISNAPGLEIVAIAVENNVDPATSRAIGDRLQISLKNVSDKNLTDFEVYYKMTDTTTGQSEGYYEKLEGLTLAANEIKTIFFDNQTGTYHYPENKYSLYRTSPNEVVFDVEISSPTVKIATATVAKGPGTGEQPD